MNEHEADVWMLTAFLGFCCVVVVTAAVVWVKLARADRDE